MAAQAAKAIIEIKTARAWCANQKQVRKLFAVVVLKVLIGAIGAIIEHILKMEGVFGAALVLQIAKDAQVKQNAAPANKDII